MKHKIINSLKDRIIPIAVVMILIGAGVIAIRCAFIDAYDSPVLVERARLTSKKYTPYRMEWGDVEYPERYEMVFESKSLSRTLEATEDEYNKARLGDTVDFYFIVGRCGGMKTFLYMR